MKINLRTIELDRTIEELVHASKMARSARNNALRKITNETKREIRHDQRSNKTSIISRKLRHRYKLNFKWKSRLIDKNYNAFSVIFASGYSTRFEKGGYITVPERFKKYLKTHGIYMRKDTEKVPIKGIALVEKAYIKLKPQIASRFSKYFMQEMGRKIRGKIFR